MASQKELDLKAACVYQILKYVDWKEPSDGELHIGVIGDLEMAEALKPYETKRVWGQVLVVEIVKDVSMHSKAYDVVYFRSDVVGYEHFLTQKGVLSIGDASDFIAKGGILQLQKANLRIKLKCNHEKAEALGLTLSSQLLKLCDR